MKYLSGFFCENTQPSQPITRLILTEQDIATMIRTQKPEQPYKETTNIKQTKANETKAWFRGILHQLASKRSLHTVFGMGWNDISVPYHQQHWLHNICSHKIPNSLQENSRSSYRSVH